MVSGYGGYHLPEIVRCADSILILQGRAILTLLPIRAPIGLLTKLSGLALMRILAQQFEPERQPPQAPLRPVTTRARPCFSWHNTIPLCLTIVIPR